MNRLRRVRGKAGMSEIVTNNPSGESMGSMRSSTTSELTSTARKIMEVFRYFKIKKNDYLSVKLVSSKRHLWRDIDDETFNDAIDALIEKGYIYRMEDSAGWRLLTPGEEYLKQSEAARR
jgi:hypothetical protein